MYRNIKSRFKFNNTLSIEFSSYVGIIQGEYLSPFLFRMYFNDLESELMQNGVDCIDIGMGLNCIYSYMRMILQFSQVLMTVYKKD